MSATKSRNRIAVTLVILLSLFMVATVVIAVWQDDLGWGWWWTVVLGAGFVALVMAFRVILQRAHDRAQLLDEELDRLEREAESSGR